ncbi:MAG: isopenicillin N synthase family oxygenase [Mesorhizobium sp.]|nr:isopenicillin N synthase family oxygenase [Mesorhizobium sp. M1A.F.Ca.IN.020.04.1.1]RUW02141.1 isopenicillin N synthase family oxygenase [Mesorhizobium sp. M1A.F.Ca.IN.020.03.1.1]RWH20341.1 MAG: isopenicillin N synthase family oxygenase [Mesorhizobium sp.]RWH40315.1 MAG: isopenicillin N synthase family oxygenase [Mesorhizobium sp.]TIR56529.1 MAG: isopenicillin N synthase family oxygenase [Mesorhizobium sp.]
MEMSKLADAIPVLDFSGYEANPDSRRRFLEELRRAARDVGFFYLSGHGIPQSLIDDVLSVSGRFFALPDEDKLEIEMVNSPRFRGYNRVGQEPTKGQRDWREQVDIGSEAPSLPRDAGQPAWRRLQGPNQWPSALPELKPLLLEWQERLTELSTKLLKAFATILEQDENAFEAIYAGTPNHLKIIRYPGRDATESEQGVGAHKDSGFLTLLLQEREGGLQVEAADGNWIDAEPRGGTFVVNIGELLEMATDGYLKATVHRVVKPPAGTDRLSVAFFLGAPFDAEIPLLDLTPHLKAQASGVTRDPQNLLYRNSGQNALKSRLRSHPDVARRHHADLIAAQARAEVAPFA